MQTAEQEERRRRKNRKCTGTLSKQELIKRDCEDAEKAMNTRDVYNYTAKERIISAAKKQAELIYREYKGTDQLEEKYKTVSSEVRNHFKNQNHQSEATRIIHEEFGGKYTRHYTSKEHELLLYGKMQEHPECTDLTIHAFEEAEHVRKIINSDVMPDTAKNALDDTTKDLRHDAVKWAKRNNITWNYRPGDDQTPNDLNEGKEPEGDKASTEPAPPLTDEQKKEKARMLIDELRDWAHDIMEVTDNMEANNYFGSVKTLDECRSAVKAERILWVPLKDKKCVYDYEQYVKIMSDYKKHTARYASNNSAIMLSRILPKETLSRIAQELRKSVKEISRYTMAPEQIDSVYSKIHNDMGYIIRDLRPTVATLSKNFRECEQGYRAMRELSKKDKQSENAFGKG